MTRPSVGALLAAAARDMPDLELVVDEDRRVTAEQAWESARRLTAVLEARGLPVGARVAVVAPRSLRSVVLTLGLLVSGRVPLVLEPRLPDLAERLRRGACDLLVQDGGNTLPGAQPLDALLAEVASTPPGRLPELRDDDLAYLMFTSGSTSTAKAVAVTHAGVAAGADDWVQAYGLAGRRTIAQVAGSAFDVFYCDLLRAVAGRCRLVLCPDERRRDPADVVRLLRDERVDVLDVTPALARVLLAEAAADGRGLPDLRVLVLGGEAWRVAQLREIRASLPACRVFNSYGLVETTVEVVAGELPDDLPGRAPEEVVPLGRPHPACRTWVGPPDGPLRPEGELWVAGPYVAAGYLRDDGTVDDGRFRRDGESWFATGDLVRRAPDGVLHYVGRGNTTVKVHGTRVDLDEVDDVLAAHPAVRASTTVLLGGPVAVLATAWVGDERTRSDTLRRHVATVLEPVAVPTLVVRLDGLPLNDSGKVDRRAVGDALAQAWHRQSADPADGDGADLLEVLRRTCLVDLGLLDVDVDVRLGELGLDSLQVMQLVAGAGRRAGRRVPLAHVFRDPTLRELAAAFRDDGDRAAPPVRAARRHRLSSAQREILVHEALHADPAAYVVTWAVHVRGDLRPDLVEAALRHVQREHEPLRSRYTGDSDGWWAEPGPVDLTLVRVPRPGGDPVAVTAGGMDVAAGSPLRAWWVEGAAADEAVLVLAVHHVAVDGVGGQLLLDGVERAVADLHAGRTPATCAPEVTFGDVVEAEQAPDARDAQHWRTVLAGYRPPVPRGGWSGTRTGGGRRSCRASSLLAPGLAAELRALARTEGTTPFAVLLAAVAECERRWVGVDDVVLGYPVSRRESPWTAPLVGLLLDTALLRVTGGGLATGRAMVRTVGAALRANAEHLGPAAAAAAREAGNGSGRPLFRTWVNWLGRADRAPRLPGASTRMLRAADGPAIFGRTLYVVETDDGLRVDLVAEADAGEDLADDLLEQVLRALRHLVARPDATLREADLATARSRVGWVALAGPLRGTPLLPAGLLTGDGPLGVVEDEKCVLAGDDLRRALRAAAAALPDGDVPVLETDRTADGVVRLVAALARGGRVALWDGAHPPAWRDAYAAAVAALPSVMPGALEYVLPSSGSTGTPDAVLSSTATLGAVLGDHVAALGIGAGDRFVLTAGVAHDPVLRDVLVPLLVGARLLVPSHDVLLEPRRLLAALRRYGPTVLHLTPQRARLLAAAAAAQPLTGVRVVLVCGDVLTAADVDTLRTALPGARVVHGYGLTQVPQVVSAWDVPIGAPEVLLGPARPGSALVVVDGDGRPAGLGQPGSIEVVTSHAAHVGEGLVDVGAAGPWGVPGGGDLRRARTGDLGELLPGGLVRFLGRIRSRVSVDGEIVDVRTVAAVLAEHPDVVDVAVEAVTDGCEERLTAVVATGPAVSGLVQELRARVRSRLPLAWVPRDVVIVPAVPRGANGKVDVAAVRLLAATGPPTALDRAPSSPTERSLARLWASHLRLPEVGVDDSFFDLGGSSLLLVEVHHAMAARWGPACPDLVECYAIPTVAAMAAAVDRSRPGGAPVPTGRVRPKPDRAAERSRRAAARRP